jgi:hypothetical protein
MNPPTHRLSGCLALTRTHQKTVRPPRVPDSGEFRPASLRSVARSTTTWHPPLIRFTAAPFRSRNSPETGRALRQPAPAPKVGDLWTPQRKQTIAANETQA